MSKDSKTPGSFIGGNLLPYTVLNRESRKWRKYSGIKVSTVATRRLTFFFRVSLSLSIELVLVRLLFC